MGNISKKLGCDHGINSDKNIISVTNMWNPSDDFGRDDVIFSNKCQFSGERNNG